MLLCAWAASTSGNVCPMTGSNRPADTEARASSTSGGRSAGSTCPGPAAGADSASELGRRLSITKQSAAKTIAVLQERGYVARDPDPRDARRKRLRVTELGFDVLRQGETIFEELRDQWAQRIGAAELEGIEDHLTALVGAQPVRFDTPGWIARDVGEPA
jgi:DNA-binding MarR family transcriptional regulator